MLFAGDCWDFHDKRKKRPTKHKKSLRLRLTTSKGGRQEAAQGQATMSGDDMNDEEEASDLAGDGAADWQFGHVDCHVGLEFEEEDDEPQRKALRELIRKDLRKGALG